MIHVSHKNKFKCGLHFSDSSRIKKNIMNILPHFLLTETSNIYIA